MTGIVTGLLCQISDGTRVRTYLLTDALYHDDDLASLIEYGTALNVIPRQAGLSISEQISFQPQGGSNNVSASNIPLINAEGHFDDWGGWILSGLPQTIKRGYADQPWSEWTTIFDGVGRGKPEFVGRTRINISLNDAFSYMRQPVASQVFDDTVANERLINTTVPMVFGNAFQVDPLLTDPQILRYAVGSNVNDVPQVQEGGNPSTPIFEFVPLGFQLFANPTYKVTCNVSGPPIAGWEEGDVLVNVGDFPTWTSGLPDGWDVTEDSPYAVISETVDGDARVENTAKIDGDTGWITGTAWEALINPNTGLSFEPNPGTDSLADVLAADDGTYADVLVDYSESYSMEGGGWSFGLTQDVQPVKMDARITLETSGGNQDVALRSMYLRYPDGTTRNLLPSGTTYVPSTKGALEFTIDNNLADIYKLTRAILEDPEFEVFVQVRRVSGSNQTVKIHEIALKVHYGTVVDRLRLTSQSELLTEGNRYLLKIHTDGAASDSIKGFWGGVSAHSDPIPASDNPFAQTSAQLEGVGIHEFGIVAAGPRFAIEFDRGTGNGEQTITRIEMIDKSASRERYADLMKYLHETADRDPAEVCDTASFDLVQTQAGNPRLGWYVSDQTTRDQLAVLFSHSLGATCWGGIDGKYHAAQMRVPQQPDGEYLEAIGAFGPGHARADQGGDLRDRVHAARNVHPLRDSETAGVTTTWPEEQRQLVLAPWRITEKADWSNLVGYPTVTLTSIAPTTGDTAGGTSVTLTGAGFEAGATVTFGGAAATNIVVVSDTEITCDTPAGTAGTADVTVTVGGDSDTLVGVFEYVSGAGWTPAEITTLFWADDDLTLDGSSNVESLNDESGNARHLTNANAGERPPTGTLNGLPTVSFDGSTQHLQLDSAFLYAAGVHTVVAIIKTPNSDNDYWLSEGSTVDADTIYAPGRVEGWPFIRNDSGSIRLSVPTAAPYDTGSWVIWGYEDVETEFRKFIDAPLSPSATHAYTRSGSLTADRFSLGALVRTGGGELHTSIEVAGIIAFPGTDEATRQKCEGYLAHRRGLEANLPAGHPYKDSPP